MAFEFRTKEHSVLPGSQMIECWRDGVFVAGIFPHEDGIRITSKYMEAAYEEKKPSYSASQWVPSAIIKLGREAVI